MKIEIAHRIHPFSHKPGTACLLPGTGHTIEAFPTLIRVAGKSLQLALTGPVAEFTLQQDLEKNCVRVFGKAKEGFYELRAEAQEGSISMFAERVPASGLGYHLEGKKGILQKKDRLQLPSDGSFVLPAHVERLSLGNHRQADWDLMQKRFSLKELLPVLFCLGQKIPPMAPQPLQGTARLLQVPKDKLQLEEVLEKFLRASFTQLFIPQYNDSLHQGLVPFEACEGNPLFLVQEGFRFIRRLFFQQSGVRIEILPSLPSSFDCGRLTHIQVDGVGVLAFEWSKKQLRQMILQCQSDCEISLVFPKGLEQVRVRTTLAEKGTFKNCEAPFSLEKGRLYYFDRFQK